MFSTEVPEQEEFEKRGKPSNSLDKGYRILQIHTGVCKHFEFSMATSAKSFQRMAGFLLSSLNEWFLQNLTSVYLCEHTAHVDLQCCAHIQKCWVCPI